MNHSNAVCPRKPKSNTFFFKAKFFHKWQTLNGVNALLALRGRVSTKLTNGPQAVRYIGKLSSEKET